MKKTKGLIVLIIFLILFMTSSFAWLNITKKSEKMSTLRAGSLSLILDESTTEGIKDSSSGGYYGGVKYYYADYDSVYNPAISLNNNVFVKDGNGTMENPYTVEIN